MLMFVLKSSDVEDLFRKILIHICFVPILGGSTAKPDIFTNVVFRSGNPRDSKPRIFHRLVDFGFNEHYTHSAVVYLNKSC
jgi:hypothetical protein